MVRKSLFLFFLFSFSISLFAQYRVDSYKETGNEIRFEVSPELVPLAKLTDDIQTKLMSYYDESRPGELSLPAKSLFVAIPPGSGVTVDFRIIESSVENFNPSINPEATLTKDTTIKLNFEPPLVAKQAVKPAIEVLGYFELKGVRVVHLRLNQYSFQPATAELTTIKKIQITVIPDKPLITYNQGIRFSESALSLLKGVLINPEDAQKFASKGSSATMAIQERLAALVRQAVQMVENSSGGKSNSGGAGSSLGMGSVVGTAISATNDTTGNWIDFGANYVKIGVAKDGVYRVYGSDLQAKGVNLNEIQPATLQLLKKGIQEPIFVNDGTDNRFDPTDYIEFLGERNMGAPNYRTPNAYGQPYNEYFDRFTDTTVYWITWNRASGERAVTAPQTLGANTDTLKYYHELIHLETDVSYLNFDADIVRREMPYFMENKTFYWQRVIVTNDMKSMTANFNLNEIAGSDSVRFYARLTSAASTIQTGSHILALQVKTLYPTYDSTTLNQYDRAVLRGTAPVSLFASGNNAIKVLSYPTGTDINTVWLDWAEIEYPRNLKATSDSLLFRFPYTATGAIKSIQVTNVAADSLLLWKKGSGKKKIFVQRTGGELVLQDTVNSNDSYFLVSNAKVLKPTIYYKKQWKNLRNPQNKADYLAVSVAEFAQPVRQHLVFLKNHENLDTMFIDMNDVYDEFSYGYFSTEALREFFRTTQTTWQSPVPEYAILVGSAGYDYRGTISSYFRYPLKRNIVPSYGSPLSDNLLSVFDSTASVIPQMLVGRIPAKNFEEVRHYFEKLSNHYTQKYDLFNKRVLLLSGGDNQGQAVDFRNQNTALMQYFTNSPYSFDHNQYYRTFTPVFSNYGPFPLDEVDANIKKGGVILSYVGHSGTFHWDNDIRTPSQLLNTSNKGSLLTDFGCSTGKFGEPDVDCFAEQFLLYPTGQPISYISNSSLGFSSTASVAPALFYKSMLNDSLWAPSSALRTAKVKLIQTYGNSSTGQLFAMTNTFFGDPYLSIKIPPKPNFTFAEESLTINPAQPDDKQDSIKLTIIYYNYGSETNDSMKIRLTDISAGSTVLDTVLMRKVPGFRDSLAVFIPIKNRLGVHSLKAVLNYDHAIDEIYNDDNEASLSFIVATTSSRDNLKYSSENIIKDYLYFINPLRKPEIERIDLQIATDPQMAGATQFSVPFDSFYTKVSLSSLQKNRRYYFRVKESSSGDYGSVRTFYLGDRNGFGLTDSIAFAGSEGINAGFRNGKFSLQDRSVALHVTAAGYYDGNSAVISYNGNNALVSNTVLSHNVAVFNAEDMRFLYTQSYNLTFGNTVGDRDRYKALLDSLDESKILIVAAAHDPFTGTDADLRTKLKGFGSKYIDSVGVRDSWFMVGRKNAPVGSIPEGWKKANFGAVSFDSLYRFTSVDGSLVTDEIGPVTSWDGLQVAANTPDSSTLSFRVIGKKGDGTVDTTGYLTGSNSNYDLSFLNSSGYEKIKIRGDLKSLDKKSSPEITGLFVTYQDFTEVGTNYQSVTISADTVLPRRNLSLGFKVSNGSETVARNFKVRVESQVKNDPPVKIFETTVDSLPAFSHKAFSIDYEAPIELGTAQFIITIDPENVLKEFFRDNNTYNVPFYIKGDTSKPYLAFTIDGTDIPDGEYINPQAEFKIELYDFSSIPLTDTTTISMKLNGNPVFFKSEGVSYSFSNSNPKITVRYKPGFPDGDHEFSVVARGNASSFADTARIEKHFSVMNEAKLLNVYNYPNPFIKDTWFTFKLTQIPEQLRIVVYTVAGRKIRDMEVPVSQLKYDFNRIYWDGLDEDGDELANGVYFYRVIMKKGDKTERITEKLAIVR
jgi:hypothetical protein